MILYSAHYSGQFLLSFTDWDLFVLLFSIYYLIHTLSFNLTTLEMYNSTEKITSVLKFSRILFLFFFNVFWFHSFSGVVDQPVTERLFGTCEQTCCPGKNAIWKRDCTSSSEWHSLPCYERFVFFLLFTMYARFFFYISSWFIIFRIL